MLLFFSGLHLQGTSHAKEANILFKCLESSEVIKKDALINFLKLNDNWFEILRQKLNQIFDADISHLATCQRVGEEKLVVLKEVLDSMKGSTVPSDQEVSNLVVYSSADVVMN
jgi:hypothetical protein